MAFPPNGAELKLQPLVRKLRAEERLLPPFEDSRLRKSPPHKFVNMRALGVEPRTKRLQQGRAYGPLPAAPRLEFTETMSGLDNTITGLGMAPLQMPLTQYRSTQLQVNPSYVDSHISNHHTAQPGQSLDNELGFPPANQIGWQPVQDVQQIYSNQSLLWDYLSILPSNQGHLTQTTELPNSQFVNGSYAMTQYHPSSMSTHDHGQTVPLPFGRPPPRLDPALLNSMYNVSNPSRGTVYASLPGGRVVELPSNRISPEHTNSALTKPGPSTAPSRDQAAESDMIDLSDEDWDSAFDDSQSDDECDEVDSETKEEFRNWLIHILKQMMFVSGETAEPSTETTWMIEEIVREQVVEMLKEATTLANRRGSKSISIVDLIFQIRHNPAKVSRLKTFLSWKDVRKNVKDSDDKAGGADADALDLEDGALPGANPAAPQKTSANKKAKLILPWEVQSFYNETVPEREDEEDEEEEEQNEATLARLASADERTRNMTKDEYVYWSDCRQASFTFRKGKRFREWAGFGTIIDSKPNDDVVDILGFLTFEIVQTLTEEALRVKAAEDLANKKANILRGDNEASKKRKREGCTLFEMPEEGRTPVEPKHVREAFRRLQIVPTKYKFMRQGYAGVRTPLRMI